METENIPGTFTFIFLDGTVWTLKADNCKHYSGHAVLTNAQFVTRIDGALGRSALLAPDRIHPRLNIALYGLRAMIPETGELQ